MLRSSLSRLRGSTVARLTGRSSLKARSCSSSASAASSSTKSTAAPGGFFQRLIKDGQVDSGMWQGAAILGGVTLLTATTTEEQQLGVIKSLVGVYRKCGLETSSISDLALIEDFIRKNTAAAINVLMASPTFYFIFAKIHKETFFVSSVRSITGTLRIVPFMFFFYGSFAVVCPFITAYMMKTRNQTYEEAKGTAGMVVLLSGFVFIEALVELRGCGVTFAQMTPSSFVIFVPALVGRLAAGVLTQQNKVGVTESEPLLPASWQDGPTWQQHTYMTFDRLHLDKEFAVTCCGTAVFQHILNGVTWVLLSKGKSASLFDITKFIIGGMEGTVASGLAQAGKTFFMRACFGWMWNFCTSQNVPLLALDVAVQKAKTE